MTSGIYPDDENHEQSSHKPTAADALSRAISNLAQSEQNGWWPYVINRGPSIEATAWCSIALQANGFNKESSAKTTTFLLEKQNADGGWSTAPGCGKSDWSTAPAVLALRLLNKEKPLAKPALIDNSVINGSNFLFDLRTDPFHSVGRLFKLIVEGEDGLHYARGWPWTRDCSFWVEPTSYSLLALKLPNVPDRSIIRSSIRYASKYMHEHVCKGGGWNHGACFVLDVWAPPYTVTSAEALLALQDEPRSPTIENALEFIAHENHDSNTSLALSWTILSLHAYGKNIADKTAKLLAHQNSDGSFGTNNVVTALAILALLAAEHNSNLLKF